MNIKEIHKLEDKYKGKFTKKTHLTKNQPRKWTNKEVEHLVKLKRLGFNYEYIAKCLDRETISVSIKMKRISKTNDTYNHKHRLQKYILNQNFLDIIKPKSVLDLFAGKSWYKNKVNNLTTNDKDKRFKTDFNLDARKLLVNLYEENNKYDLIDLDPYGSAYDCFELSFKMAQKGIIITLGEFGHLRWKRTDYVEKKYNIKTLEDFNFKNIDIKIKEKAKQNNSILKKIYVASFFNIKRVYYKIIK